LLLRRGSRVRFFIQVAQGDAALRLQQVRQVVSSYLSVVYLDDLSTELNNIETGCYIGEVLLNLLIFGDDICVFCLSVRLLQSILDVCQTYAESYGIFNCSKTVCMMFKTKSAKSTVTPCGGLEIAPHASKWSPVDGAHE